MLKKLIAASAVFAFFACSGDDGDFAGGDPSSNSQGSDGSSSSQGDSPSSSSQGGDSSSSSDPGPDTLSTLIGDFNNKASQLFGSTVWPYGYTLKASQKEDLTQFWSDSLVLDSIGELVRLCPIEGPKEGESRRAPNAACELGKTNAILQNTLSSQYADLNYVIGNIAIAGSFYKAILLKEYNLKADGDQAALGLNVFAGADSEAKNIGELSASIKESLNGTVGFSYKYAGGAHEFRAVTKNDEDFWYAEIPKSAATEYDYFEWPETKISIGDFKGMGSFAEDEVPFDLSLVAKFLWVVKYDAVTPANNTGSLMVHSFNARKPK